MIDLLSIAKTEANSGDLLGHLSNLFEPAGKVETTMVSSIQLPIL